MQRRGGGVAFFDFTGDDGGVHYVGSAIIMVFGIREKDCGDGVGDEEGTGGVGCVGGYGVGFMVGLYFWVFEPVGGEGDGFVGEDKADSPDVKRPGFAGIFAWNVEEGDFSGHF